MDAQGAQNVFRPTPGIARESRLEGVESGALPAVGSGKTPPRKSLPSRMRSRRTAAPARPLGQTANWTVGLLAALLVLVSVGGYFYHYEQLAGLAGEHLRLVATGPTFLYRGVASEILVCTTTLSGRPLAAEVEVFLSDTYGRRLLTHKESTDEQGRLRVVLPPDLQLPEQVHLQISAAYDGSRAEAYASLAVLPERPTAHLMLDQPWYQAGEEVRFRALIYSRPGVKSAEEVPLHFELRLPDGNPAPDGVVRVVSRRSVGEGAFPLSRQAPTGRYTLRLCAGESDTPIGCWTFLVYPNEPITPKPSKEAARESLRITFQPEGGNLTADLVNRVYFQACAPDGKPVQIAGKLFVRPEAPEGEERIVSEVRSNEQGFGVFSFTPRLGENYRLRIENPAEGNLEKLEWRLPAVVQSKARLTLEQRIIGPKQPLELGVQAVHGGLPLLVTAYCRGAQIGEQPFLSKPAPADSKPVLNLEENISGLIRLVLYDYSVSPPVILDESFVYCCPDRKLNVKLESIARRPVSSKEIELPLLISDEQDRSVSGVLGAAVIGAQFSPTVLTDFYFSNASTIDDLEQAAVFLCSQSDPAMTETATRWLAALKSPVPSGSVPPFMFDNVEQIRARYQQCLADFQAKDGPALNAISAVSFFGGIGLMLLVAMLGLLGVVSGLHLWVAALGAATCCTILGGILLDPSRVTPEPTAPAFANYQPPLSAPTGNTSVPPDKTAPLVAETFGSQAGEKVFQPVEALLWRPFLPVGPDGKITLRFRRPEDAEAVYVLIEAYGEGRLGFRCASVDFGEKTASPPPP